MTKVFYSNDQGEHTVYIDEGNRQTTVRLPREIGEDEAWYFAKMPITQYVLQKLLEGKGDN